MFEFLLFCVFIFRNISDTNTNQTKPASQGKKDITDHKKRKKQPEFLSEGQMLAKEEVTNLLRHNHILHPADTAAVVDELVLHY